MSSMPLSHCFRKDIIMCGNMNVIRIFSLHHDAANLLFYIIFIQFRSAKSTSKEKIVLEQKKMPTNRNILTI